jgi:cytochrome P450
VAAIIPDPFIWKGRRSNVSITRIARACVMKRIQNGATRDDLLDKLISARQRESGGELDETQITELTAEVVTIL